MSSRQCWFIFRMACDQIVRWGDYDIQGFSLALETVMFKKHCFNSVLLEVESPYEPYSDYTIARAWQRCNELIFPVGCANQTMFPPQPFLQTQFDESCRRRFGIASRPQTPISFYGGRDIIESIKGFGGNIIFSNGLRDPFSSGGILKDLSKTILSVTTTQGSYALDMGFEKVTYPKWLRRQRAAERKIFRRWINQYNHRNQGSNLKHSLILYGLQGLVVLYMSKLI